MNRRTFLQVVPAAASVAVLAPSIQAQKYGCVNVDRWHQLGLWGSRVLCNGVDITDTCFEFDDEKDFARCISEPAKIDWSRPDELVEEWHSGPIQVLRQW
jgi:hypothetical protein